MKKLLSVLICLIMIAVQMTMPMLSSSAETVIKPEAVTAEDRTQFKLTSSSSSSKPSMVTGTLAGEKGDIYIKLKLNYKTLEAQILSYFTPDTNVVIPPTVVFSDFDYSTYEYVYYEFKVVSIPHIYPMNGQELKSVELPYTVKSIAKKAFGYSNGKKKYKWNDGKNPTPTIGNKIKNFKVYGVEDTYSEKYARSSGFSYKIYKNIKNAKIKFLENGFVFNNSSHRPLFSCKIDGKDITLNNSGYRAYESFTSNSKQYIRINDALIAQYSNNVDAGKAKVTITPSNETEYRGCKVAHFNIAPANYKDFKKSIVISKISAQPYTGGSVVPKVQIKFNGSKLTQGKDYTVTASNNVKLGKNAKATIKFTKNFKGSVNKTFAIEAVPINSLKATCGASTVKIKWEGVPQAYYKVYRQDPSTKKYKCLSTLGTTSFTDKNPPQLKTVNYKVVGIRKINGKEYKQNSVKSCKTDLFAPVITLTTRKTGTTITWKKNPYAKGYAVYRTTGYNNARKIKTLNGSNSTSYTDKGVTGDNNAYYYVRAFAAFKIASLLKRSLVFLFFP